MSFGSSSFPLTRCSGVCAGTGRPLGPDEACIGTLVEIQGQSGFDREDYSLEAWEAGKRPVAPRRLFASWKTTNALREDDKPRLLSDPELLDLFEEVATAEDERRAAFRYLLGILLIRRRLLRQVGMDGRALLVVTKAASEGATPIRLEEPAMDDQVIAEALEQLSQIVPGADARTRNG